MKKTINKKAYVTLISVLIVGAIGSAISISLVLLGLGSSRNSLLLLQSAQAKAMANSCAEEALQVLAEVPGFSGNGSLTIDGNTCTYTVTVQGFDTEVSATGNVGEIVRKAGATMNLNGVKWREMS